MVAPPLTARQRQVLETVFEKEGSYKEAAHELGLSIDGVRMHLRGIYARAEVHTLIGALRRYGYVSVGPPE